MKVPFGLHKKTNKYIGIDEAKNGLACGCICPSCKMQLIARQGDKNEDHFSHYKSAQVECEYSYWVAVRSMAKQLIEKKKIIAVDISSESFFMQLPYSRLKIHKTKADPRVPKYQFDLFISSSIGTFYVYFITASEDAGRTRMHYRNRGIYFNEKNILEIDLSSMRRNSKNVTSFLEELLFKQTNNKSFLLPSNCYSKHGALMQEVDYLIEEELSQVKQKPLPLSHDNIKIFNKLPSYILDEAYAFYKNHYNHYTELHRGEEDFIVLAKNNEGLFFIRYFSDYYSFIFYCGNYYVFSIENKQIIPYPIKEKSIYETRKQLELCIQEEIENIF